MNIEQKVVETLKTFPLEKQQEVLDFIESLKSRMPSVEINSQDSKPFVSALELAQEWVGCVEGPGDLSTNKQYLEGLGSE